MKLIHRRSAMRQQHGALATVLRHSSPGDQLNPTRTRRRVLAAEIMPVVLALVLAACGGSDTAETTTTTAATTTTMAQTTTSAAPATTSAPATTAADGDLPTVLESGTYLVGSEVRVGPWTASECGCLWASIAADGTETVGAGDDAMVLETDHAVLLGGGCTWTFDG
jgi:hypothetical protein